MKRGGIQDGVLPCYFSSEVPTFITMFIYTSPCASGLKKIQMDDLGVPPIENFLYLLRKKTCVSFGLINLIYMQIL